MTESANEAIAAGDDEPGPDVVRAAVRSACRAPSLYNSQPWRWVAEQGVLRIFVEPSRIVHMDRQGRHAHLGCGAALECLRVAFAGAGWDTHIEHIPSRDDPLHLATITVTRAGAVSDDQRRRADAIWSRRSDRSPFYAPTEWECSQSALRVALGKRPVRLDVLAESMRPRLIQAAQVVESLRRYDTDCHCELDWWTTPFDTAHGISYSSLVSAADSERVGMNRTFPVPYTAAEHADITHDQSTVLMLSTAADDAESTLVCGEALAALLLECTAAGLATCTVTYLTELSATRRLLAALTYHDDLPQALIRVGIPARRLQSPAATQRLPVTEVLDMSHRCADTQDR